MLGHGQPDDRALRRHQHRGDPELREFDAGITKPTCEVGGEAPVESSAMVVDERDRSTTRRDLSSASTTTCLTRLNDAARPPPRRVYELVGVGIPCPTTRFTFCGSLNRISLGLGQRSSRRDLGAALAIFPQLSTACGDDWYRGLSGDHDQVPRRARRRLRGHRALFPIPIESVSAAPGDSRGTCWSSHEGRCWCRRRTVAVAANAASLLVR